MLNGPKPNPDPDPKTLNHEMKLGVHHDLHFLNTTAPPIATQNPTTLVLVVFAPIHNIEIPMSNKSFTPPATFMDRALVRPINQKMLRFRANAVIALKSRIAKSSAVRKTSVITDAS